MLMLKPDKNPAKVLAIFIDTVIKTLYLRTVEKAQNGLLELSASLAWDNFHQCNPHLNGLSDYTVKLPFNRTPVLANIMKIEF